MRGRSKEKRNDCALVTLALVLDGSGFIRRSEVLPGNVSEPKTLEQALNRLRPGLPPGEVTVVMDAGIATEENIDWLKTQEYRYLVVSRQRHRQFDENAAVAVKDDGLLQVKAQRVVDEQIIDEQMGEVRLYCHSSAGRKKNGRWISFFPSVWKPRSITWPLVYIKNARSNATPKSSNASAD